MAAWHAALGPQVHHSGLMLGNSRGLSAMLRASPAQEKAPPDRTAALREEFATKSSADAAAENV